jgi:hypothetical protein
MMKTNSSSGAQMSRRAMRRWRQELRLLAGSQPGRTNPMMPMVIMYIESRQEIPAARRR